MNLKHINDLMTNHLSRSKRSMETNRWGDGLIKNIFGHFLNSIGKYQEMGNLDLTETQILNMH